MNRARSGYNVIMNDETFTPCTKCGRPMAYCKGQCCGKPKGCCCQEYGPMKPGCIREVKPGCPYKAVIPTLTVEDKSNLKDLADCFVHVSNINTTFYIDDKHRTIVTWAGPVEYDNYDLDANTLGLRSQFLIDHANDYAAYYNKTGEYQKFNFSKGDNETLSFTMQYDAGTQANALPGWYPGQQTEVLLGGESHSRKLYKRDILYDRNDAHPVTFLNDSTGETITPEALYALLLDGADVALNHVPLGTIWQDEWVDPTPYVDGVHLTKFYSRAGSGEDSYSIIGFGGSASVYMTPPTAEAYVPAQLSFIIDGFTPTGGPADSVPVYEGMSAQGFYDADNLN